MALSAQQMEIARAIDAEIRQIIDNGGGDEEILRAMPDHMSNFKLLLDSAAPGELDALCRQYDGFYRFAQLLERMAQAIADGSLTVPRARKRRLPKPKPKRDK
jgi:hypothetical protein